MEAQKKKKLSEIASKVRMGVIEGTHAAKSGHPGGSLSITDILTYLYFEEMKVRITTKRHKTAVTLNVTCVT